MTPENKEIPAKVQTTDKELIDVRKIRLIFEHIGNKWSVLILNVLCVKPSRFNEIRRQLDGITHKALADALKRMERNGLVRREVLPTMPVGVEYSLTELGRTLQEPVVGLYSWAVTYGPELERAQIEFDRKREQAT